MVILKITSAGFNSAFNAQNNGLELRLSMIKFGSGKYNVVDNDPRTAMVAPFLAAGFVGGGVEPISHTLRFNCSFKDNQTRDVYEIGLFTEDGVLFAVMSTTGEPFFSTSKTLTTVFIGGLKLDAINSSNVSIILDENGALALQLFGAHEAHSNPHPQYAMNSEVEYLSDQVENLFVRKNQVTDNLDSTSSTNVLSARMGNKLMRDAAWRVFFGQVSSSIINSDNTNTFIRLLSGDLLPIGGSTQVTGEGNVEVSAISGVLKILGKLNNTLNSTAVNEALTALQGKVLNEKIDTVSNYVWNNIIDFLNNKYDKTGGTINGNASINGILQINADSPGADVTIRPNSLTHGNETQLNVLSGNKIECYYLDKPIRAPTSVGGQWVTLTGDASSTSFGTAPQRNIKYTVPTQRARNTTYYNTSSKMIAVMISLQTSDDYMDAYYYIGAERFGAYHGNQTSGTGNWVNQIIFFVLPGESYKIQCEAQALVEWVEFRDAAL